MRSLLGAKQEVALVEAAKINLAVPDSMHLRIDIYPVLASRCAEPKRQAPDIHSTYIYTLYISFLPRGVDSRGLASSGLSRVVVRTSSTPQSLQGNVCLVRGPDVLYSGIVGMQGSMVIRLRPCTTSVPPSRAPPKTYFHDDGNPFHRKDKRVGQAPPESSQFDLFPTAIFFFNAD